MTMYITVATTARVVQASDRRITNYLGGRPRSQVDGNKSIVVHHVSGSFTLAYAGIARVGAQSTDELVAGLWKQLCRDRLPIKPLFVRFARRLSERLRRAKPPRNLSISAAGYYHTGELFWARITNHESEDGTRGSVQDKFAVYGRVIDKPTRSAKKKSTYVEIGGIADEQGYKLVSGPIKSLRRSRFFHRVSGEAVAKKLVEIIQQYAQSPLAQNLVGTNCMATVLNAPPAIDHLFRYYSLGKVPISYGPYFVIDDSSVRGFAEGIVIEGQVPN